MAWLFDEFASFSNHTLVLELHETLYQIVEAALSSTDALPMMHTLSIEVVRVRDDYNSLFDVLRSRREHSTLKSFIFTLRPLGSSAGSSPFLELALAHLRDLADSRLQKLHALECVSQAPRAP
ncbi:hypothetical protein B0H19DRAFT_1245510 [Mycena capillaripes]|nr:hypothetical protein B0H19DRAFT_1245510 [Mycena capillaripes]